MRVRNRKAARFQIRRINCLLFSPREPEITAFDFALRLSILPKYDALDIVLLKVITNSLEVSRHIRQNANTVFLNHIFFKSIWICTKMRTDCFVSAFLRRAAGIAIGFHKPDIALVALVHGNPVRPVAGYGVRIAAGNRIHRRNLAALCIVSFVRSSCRRSFRLPRLHRPEPIPYRDELCYGCLLYDGYQIPAQRASGFSSWYLASPSIISSSVLGV